MPPPPNVPGAPEADVAAARLVKNLPDDLLSAVLSRLPVDERLKDKLVSKRWADALRDPAAWTSIDLREKPGGLQAKILRFMALANTSSAPSASQLRFLGLNLTSGERALAHSRAKLADIGRDPSASTVEQLALNVQCNTHTSVDCPAFLSVTSVREFWEDHERGSFPSLKHLSVGRLLVDIGEALPALGGAPESVLAACSRVAPLRASALAAPLPPTRWMRGCR